MPGGSSDSNFWYVYLHQHETIMTRTALSPQDESRPQTLAKGVPNCKSTEVLHMHKLGPMAHLREKGLQSRRSGFGPSYRWVSLFWNGHISFFLDSVSLSIEWINGASVSSGLLVCVKRVIWARMEQPMRSNDNSSCSNPRALCYVRGEQQVQPLIVFLNINAYVPKVECWIPEHWVVPEKSPLMMKIYIWGADKDINLC